MNQKRQPKGTTIGGQFAQSKNSESNLNLGRPAITMESLVDRLGRHLTTDRYYVPNEDGLDLVNRSSIVIIEQTQTPRGGIVWNGRLDIDGEIVSVYNDGNGGVNRYDANGGIQRVRELNAMVARGFPHAAPSEALDAFCLVVEVAHEPSLD